jgi:AAA domain
MATGEQIEWIVPGFVARGAVTELGAKVKAGKTTLITKLVRAVADGLDFLSKPTLKTPTVYLTEQPIVSFRQAMDRAGLLGRADFRVLQHTDTRGIPWPEMIAAAVCECKRVGAMLLVIDTLPQFAGLKGDSENNSGDALTAMDPILQAAADGIGTLTRHSKDHPRYRYAARRGFSDACRKPRFQTEGDFQSVREDESCTQDDSNDRRRSISTQTESEKSDGPRNAVSVSIAPRCPETHCQC